MTRIICLLLVGLLGTFTGGLAKVQTPSIEKLSWISGCWQGRLGDAALEEQWTKPAGGSLLGFSRTIRNGRTLSYEFMQIREENDGIFFIAQPQGGNKVPFKLIRLGEKEAVFENKEHDFPQRIIYKRDGQDSLLPRIEGAENGKPGSQEFPMKKVPCE